MRQPGDRTPAPPELSLAQDLANTVDIEMGHDELTGPEALMRFAGDHGMTMDATAADLARILAFRETLRDVCRAHAGFDASPQAVRRFNDETARALLSVVVSADGSARITPAAGLAGADLLLGQISVGVATACATGTWQRLKACAADGCRWVYFDRSPGGRGRWCTMGICGSRAKVRSYRQRQTELATSGLVERSR
jgi:predicted RNA-binding Zn ribbon-like protein